VSLHEEPDEGLRERAALFVLDALDPAESSAMRLHLVACPVCAAEVRAFAEATQELGHLAPEAELPRGLWERVLARVRSSTGQPAPATSSPSVQVWRRWESERAGATELTVVRATQDGFEPTAIPGIAVRRLALDREAGRVTMLVRMAPGTSYPAHRHGGPEECLVLEGDIAFAGCRMQRGDFQRVEQGSVHPVQSTESGCLLMISSSLSDELL
jgi:putative transcriptional regulator